MTEEDVVSMNRRLAGDCSLNAPVRNDAESGEWQDWLVDDTVDQETALAESEERDQRRGMLNDALKGLNERERRVFEARRLADEPLTLEELSAEFGVSPRAHPPDRGARLREGAEGGAEGRGRSSARARLRRIVQQLDVNGIRLSRRGQWAGDRYRPLLECLAQGSHRYAAA